MILKSLFFLFSLSALATPPECRRPNNFANPGALTAFESCLKKQKAYCVKNEKLPDCEKLNRKAPVKTAEQSLAENCLINSVGVYRCKSKPLKLMDKEAAPISAPIKYDDGSAPMPTQTPSPTPSPTSSAADPGGSLAIPPPPPAVVAPPVPK